MVVSGSRDESNVDPVVREIAESLFHAVSARLQIRTTSHSPSLSELVRRNPDDALAYASQAHDRLPIVLIDELAEVMKADPSRLLPLEELVARSRDRLRELPAARGIRSKWAARFWELRLVVLYQDLFAGIRNVFPADESWRDHGESNRRRFLLDQPHLGWSQPGSHLTLQSIAEFSRLDVTAVADAIGAEPTRSRAASRALCLLLPRQGMTPAAIEKLLQRSRTRELVRILDACEQRGSAYAAALSSSGPAETS